MQDLAAFRITEMDSLKNKFKMEQVTEITGKYIGEQFALTLDVIWRLTAARLPLRFDQD